jgi:hypothetical protein
MVDQCTGIDVAIACKQKELLHLGLSHLATRLWSMALVVSQLLEPSFSPSTVLWHLARLLELSSVHTWWHPVKSKVQTARVVGILSKNCTVR